MVLRKDIDWATGYWTPITHSSQCCKCWDFSNLFVKNQNQQHLWIVLTGLRATWKMGNDSFLGFKLLKIQLPSISVIIKVMSSFIGNDVLSKFVWGTDELKTAEL